MEKVKLTGLITNKTVSEGVETPFNYIFFQLDNGYCLNLSLEGNPVYDGSSFSGFLGKRVTIEGGIKTLPILYVQKLSDVSVINKPKTTSKNTPKL